MRKPSWKMSAKDELPKLLRVAENLNMVRMVRSIGRSMGRRSGREEPLGATKFPIRDTGER
jgi:hypothetical protein